MPTDLTLPSRDLTGYGANPPDPKWPGKARIAVNFCINYEEGAEMCVLNGDDRSEVRVSDLVVEARPGGRDLNMESAYEYGSRAGYWRLIRAFTGRGLPATVNLVGLAGELVPEPLAAMVEAGFDLQPHGWRWIDYHAMAEETERALIRQSREQVERLTGQPPLGYYAGMPSINTRRLAIEEGYVFDSDCYNDDLPWWSHDYSRPHLVILYSLETNDSRFGRREGFQVGGEFFTYLKDSFDVLYAEGAEAPKMMTVGLHARLLGRPGRIGALHRILDYMAGHERVWITRREDIARHWMAVHPAG
jgi:putative urate catabolism protein